MEKEEAIELNDLQKACKEGNWKLVEELLEKGISPVEEDLFDRTSLHFAFLHPNFIEQETLINLFLEKEENDFTWLINAVCFSGNKENVEKILEKYEKDLISNSFSLRGACQGGNEEIIELMIQKGAKDWDLGLMAASIGGHKKIVEKMIKKGAKELNWPLKEASIVGDKEIVNFLIEHGAFAWNFALKGACKGKHKELIDLMLKKGASRLKCVLEYACVQGDKELAKKVIEVGLESYKKTFYKASKKGNIEMINFLIENGICEWESGFSGACESENIELINFFIEKGACNFNNGLKIACEKGNIKIAELMIELGVGDLNKSLHYACEKGKKEIVDFLIKNGVKDWNEGLKGAAKGGHIDLVEMMIAKGATKFKEAFSNSTKFPKISFLLLKKLSNNKKQMIEVLMGYSLPDSKVIKEVILRGGNPNHSNFYGKTCFHNICGGYNVKVDTIDFFLQNGAEGIDGALVAVCENWHFHPECIEFLLNKNANPNFSDDYYRRTPLHFVCDKRPTDLRTIKLLLSKGANLNAVDKDGKSPLHLACAEYNEEILEFLIENKADINLKDSKDKTPIHYCCSKPIYKYEEIERYLKYYPVEVDDQLLGVCESYYPNLEIIKILLDKKANPNFKNPKGNTPLHLVIKNHNISFESTKLLIEKGADPKLKDNENKDSLYYLCSNSCINVEIIKYLESKGVDSFNTGFVALCNNHIYNPKVFEYFFTKKVDPNQNGKFEPLLFVVSGGYYPSFSTTKMFLENGVDPNFQYDSKNVLHHILKVDEFHFPIVKLLIEKGTNLNALDDTKNTPLHFLCGNKYATAKLLKFLIEKGADLNLKNEFYKIPIFLAFEIQPLNHKFNEILLDHFKNPEIVDDDYRSLLFYSHSIKLELLQKLIDKKIDVNLKDKDQITPLFAFCEKKANIPNIKLLLENQADPNLVSKEMPLLNFLCKDPKNYEIISLLLAFKADPNIVSSDFMVASEVANSHENFEIFNLLKEFQERGTIFNQQRCYLYPLSVKKQIFTLILINKFYLNPKIRFPKPIVLYISSFINF